MRKRILRRSIIPAMPRGLTPEQQAYARELFVELEKRFPNQKEIGDLLRIDQSRVSNIRSTGKTSMQTLIGAAKLLGRPYEELARRTGMPSSAPAHRSTDPYVGKFLLALNEIPGLKKWLTDPPQAVRLTEVCLAIDAYENSPGLARESDGQPHQGWGRFFEDVRAGRIGGTTGEPGAADAVAAIEREQNPHLGKSLQPTPHKSTKPKRK